MLYYKYLLYLPYMHLLDEVDYILHGIIYNPLVLPYLLVLVHRYILVEHFQNLEVPYHILL